MSVEDTHLQPVSDYSAAYFTDADEYPSTIVKRWAPTEIRYDDFVQKVRAGKSRLYGSRDKHSSDGLRRNDQRAGASPFQTGVRNGRSTDDELQSNLDLERNILFEELNEIVKNLERQIDNLRKTRRLQMVAKSGEGFQGEDSGGGARRIVRSAGVAGLPSKEDEEREERKTRISSSQIKAKLLTNQHHRGLDLDDVLRKADKKTSSKWHQTGNEDDSDGSGQNRQRTSTSTSPELIQLLRHIGDDSSSTEKVGSIGVTQGEVTSQGGGLGISGSGRNSRHTAVESGGGNALDNLMTSLNAGSVKARPRNSGHASSGTESRELLKEENGGDVEIWNLLEGEGRGAGTEVVRIPLESRSGGYFSHRGDSGDGVVLLDPVIRRMLAAEEAAEASVRKSKRGVTRERIGKHPPGESNPSRVTRFNV